MFTNKTTGNKSAVLAIVILITVLLMYINDRIIINRDNELHARKIEQHIIHIDRHLIAEIKNVISIVESISHYIEYYPEISGQEFSAIVKPHLISNPNIKVFQITDQDTRIKYVYPAKGNEITGNNPLTLLQDPFRVKYVRKTIEDRDYTIQGPYELRQGGLGIVIRYPVFDQDQNLAALVIGICSLDIFLSRLETLFSNSGYLFSIVNTDNIKIRGNFHQEEEYVSHVFNMSKDGFTLNYWRKNIYSRELNTRRAIYALHFPVFSAIIVLIVLYSRSRTAYLHRLEEEVDIKTESLKKELDIKNNLIKSLTSSEDKFLKALNTSHEGIIITGVNGEIIETNQAFCLMTGFSRSEIIGMKIDDILREEKGWENKSHAELRRNRRYFHFETILKKKDTTFIDVDVNSSFSGQDFTYILSFIRDITEKKEMEDEKRKMENQLRKLQRNETIAILSSEIAHDFNSIISPILGYADIIEFSTEKNSNFNRFAKNIRICAEKARDLTGKLLKQGKASSGKAENIYIDRIVIETTELMRMTLPSTITIINKIKDKNVPVYADPLDISQVLMNLITNAYHAFESREDGIITVTLEVKEKSAVISVKDNGRGIRKEDINKIFNPYFTTKGEDKGTGLGLSISNSIIKSLGGEITVESREGKGSEFSILLPVYLDKKEDITPGKSAKILLIDDEETFLEYGKHILKESGFEVIASENPLEALDIYRKNPSDFALVITDHSMPGDLGGREVSEEIFRLNPESAVIVCSGHTEELIRDEYKHLGISLFLSKPLDRNDFIEKINTLLNSSF